jgi:hypothetical protein
VVVSKGLLQTQSEDRQKKELWRLYLCKLICRVAPKPIMRLWSNGVFDFGKISADRLGKVRSLLPQPRLSFLGGQFNHRSQITHTLRC